jgi:ArsR family metal-binding transcriptional regulator
MTTWKAAKRFPRWLNTETSDALKVKTGKGKAILFYNLLPDGNYDERINMLRYQSRKETSISRIYGYGTLSWITQTTEPLQNVVNQINRRTMAS